MQRLQSGIWYAIEVNAQKSNTMTSGSLPFRSRSIRSRYLSKVDEVSCDRLHGWSIPVSWQCFGQCVVTCKTFLRGFVRVAFLTAVKSWWCGKSNPSWDLNLSRKADGFVAKVVVDSIVRVLRILTNWTVSSVSQSLYLFALVMIWSDEKESTLLIVWTIVWVLKSQCVGEHFVHWDAWEPPNSNLTAQRTFVVDYKVGLIIRKAW